MVKITFAYKMKIPQILSEFMLFKKKTFALFLRNTLIIMKSPNFHKISKFVLI